MATRKNMAGMKMAEQLEMMYRVDHMFRSDPKRMFTLAQVSSLLGVTIRTVERLYDSMKVFGAPIKTVNTMKGGAPGGSNYGEIGAGPDRGKKHGYIFSVEYPVILRVMSKKRMRQEQVKAMRARKRSNLLRNLLTNTS